MIQFSLILFKKFIIIICHPEINFINNCENRNFIHRSVKPCSFCLNRKTARRIRINFKIFKTRLPYLEMINIILMKPLNFRQIFQFICCKTQMAVLMYLFFYLFSHLLCKDYPGITAFKSPFCLIRRKLMINRLPHRKFVKVSFKQTSDNWLQFHKHSIKLDIIYSLTNVIILQFQKNSLL